MYINPTWEKPKFGCRRKYELVRIYEYTVYCCCCFWRDSPQWAKASSFTRFLDHIQRRTTFGSTPLDEWSARRRDLCLTTHNNRSRQTSMPSVGFEPKISAGERPQTYVLDRAATGTGTPFITPTKFIVLINTNIQGTSPSSFTTSVQFSGKTKCQF
jgi:hypothetical protein